MLGSCAGTAHEGPRQTDLKGTLFAFISEAAAANIVSGVQVSLLNELAVQFSGKQTLRKQLDVRPIFATERRRHACLLLTRRFARRCC